MIIKTETPTEGLIYINSGVINDLRILAIRELETPIDPVRRADLQNFIQHIDAELEKREHTPPPPHQIVM